MSKQSSKPLIEADPTKGVKVNAGVVAKSFRDEIKAKVGAMKHKGIGKFKLRWLLIFDAVKVIRAYLSIVPPFFRI